MEKLTEELLGCRLSTLEILYFLIGKEEADHGTYLIDPELYVMLLQYIRELSIQIVSLAFEVSVIFRVSVQNAQHGISCVHGERNAGKCAGLIDRPGRCDHIHNSLFPSKCTYRKACSYNFSISDKICFPAEPLLGTASCNTEARHHLIINEKGLMGIATLQTAYTHSTPVTYALRIYIP